MAKGISLRIDPFCSDDQRDFLNLASSSSKSPSSSSIFPYLRRLDIKDDMSSPRHKNPLLTLKLSSHSFLDATINDGLSDSPLYTIKTGNSSTTVLRYDPWEGPTNVADIQWPAHRPVKGKGKEEFKGVLVQTSGNRRKAVGHFLKYGTLSGSRSFTIPNYPHTFKWKRSGSTYHCTTTSVKGPVAILDGAESFVSPRIRVFEALLVQDTRPQLDRGGVSLNLLDHLLVTALLLVTDAEEWVTFARPGNADGPPSTSSSVRQWRKIVYGEPLFPSLRAPSDECLESSKSLEEDIRPPSPTNTSVRQMRKIVFGEPLFPSLSRAGSDELAFASRSSISLHDIASESSASESINYPSTPVSHGFIDPSFYDKDIPPIPEFPQQSTSRSPSLHPPSTPPTLPYRSLPKPPIPSSSSVSISPFLHASKSLHRSRSTPFLKTTNLPSSSGKSHSPDSSNRSPSSQSTHVRTHSPNFLSGGTRTLRKLPQLPHSSDVAPTSPTPTLPPRTEKSRSRSNTQRSLPEPPQPEGTSESAHEEFIRRSMEKEAIELAEWVGSLTPEQQRRHHQVAASSHNAVFDAPPPAYNAIDFSHPPHASAPTESGPPASLISSII